jgi:GGDEF domain-containing protein
VRSIAGRIPVTIRIGVLVARDWGNPTTEEVLREVDAALYAAKAAGRNCSILAAPQISVCAVRGLYER